MTNKERLLSMLWKRKKLSKTNGWLNKVKTVMCFTLWTKVNSVVKKCSRLVILPLSWRFITLVSLLVNSLYFIILLVKLPSRPRLMPLYMLLIETHLIISSRMLLLRREKSMKSSWKKLKSLKKWIPMREIKLVMPLDQLLIRLDSSSLRKVKAVMISSW